MITEAITKITGEVNNIKGDHAQQIGEYLIDHMTDESAAKIMDEKKTLSGCISAVTSKAKARATNNCAMIADTEVFSWVRDYYGICNAQDAKIVPAAADAMNINLLDLM